MATKTASYKKTLEKRLCLHYLMDISKPGVFALVNPKQKLVLVIGSSYPLKALTTVITSLANNTHSSLLMRKHKKRLSLCILEQCEKKDILANKLKWIDYYQTLGYTLYNTELLPKYRIAMRVNLDTRRAEVGVVSKGKRWYIVTDFPNVIEANEFMKTHTVFDILKMV